MQNVLKPDVLCHVLNLFNDICKCVSVHVDTVYITCRKENKKGSIRSIREAQREAMHASYKKDLNCFASSGCVMERFGFSGGYIHKSIFNSEKYKSSVKLQNFHSKWLLELHRSSLSCIMFGSG